MGKSFLNLFSLALLVSLAACDVGTDGPPVEPTDELDSPNVSDPIAIAQMAERIVLSYRPQGTAIVGSRSTYSVRAHDGVVSISPRHYPNGDLDAKIEGAPLKLETIAISRSEPFDLGQSKSEVFKGDLRIDRGVAVEYFKNSPDSVEQSWELDHAPEGKGDLVLLVRADGQKYGGWDDDGHHFIDEETNIGFRYGRATWIDAKGVATDVPVIFDDGVLVLTVPAKIVDDSAYPAVLDPIVFAELALTGSLTGPSGFDETLPAISYDGTNWLVVWADNRSTTTDDIYGQRVTESGNVLDPTSIPIVTAGFQQTMPGIAYNGTNHLLIWTDMRTGDADVRGMIINTAGTAISPEFVIAGGAGAQENTDIAQNGTGWFVTWEDDSGGTDAVRYARIDSAGNVLDPGGIAVSSSPGIAQRIPAVHGNGTGGALIAWTHGNTNEDILAVRVNGATVVDAVPLVATASVGRNLGPDVAFDGTQYMVTWWRGQFIGANRIVAATGQVLDGNGLTVAGWSSTKSSPSIAHDGVGFFIVWNDSIDNPAQDIVGRTVTSTGGLINSFYVTLTEGTQRLPVVAPGNAGINVIAWHDTRSGRSDIFGTRVFKHGSAPIPGNVSLDSTGIAYSRAAIRQTAAEVAADTRNFLVVWANSERVGFKAGGANHLLAMRIRASTGVPVDPSGLIISALPDNQTAPDVVYNPTSNQFLIVWADRQNGNDFDIFASRVVGFGGTGGPLLDGSGFPIASGPGDQTFPAVAWNAASNSYLIVWQDRANGANFDIRGARMLPNGTILDTPALDIAVVANEQIHPDVASDGTGWAVVWTDSRCAASNCQDIYTSYVTNAPSVDANRVVSDAANRQETSRIAFNGTDFLVVWADTRNGLLDPDIFGAQLAIGGAVIGTPDGTALATGPLRQSRPNISFVTPDYFVVWRQESGAEVHDIVGQSFSPALAPIQGAPFLISGRAENEDEPAVAAFSGANTMVVYQVFDPSPALRSVRVFARRVTFP